jgi:hypothetical protein
VKIETKAAKTIPFLGIHTSKFICCSVQRGPTPPPIGDSKLFLPLMPSLCLRVTYLRKVLAPWLSVSVKRGNPAFHLRQHIFLLLIHSSCYIVSLSLGKLYQISSSFVYNSAKRSLPASHRVRQHLLGGDAFVVEKCPIHLKKISTIFPSPAAMSLTKLSLAGNNLIFPRQGEFWLVTSWLGTGKSLTFFLQCSSLEKVK